MKRALYNFAGRTMIVLLFVPALYTLDVIVWLLRIQPLRQGFAGSNKAVRESWEKF